jgi:G3E family GTPase
LLGEFEAAVNEIIEKVGPEIIIVETTGLAEPEALVFNIQEALPQCRLDGVVSVIDADMLIRFPELGHTTRLQIEAADILLLNKVDLVDAKQIEPLEGKLREINSSAAIIRTERCRMDPELLFGIPQSREKKIAPPQHEHQPEFESFTFISDNVFSRDCFERFADTLPANVIRAKGFVRFPDSAQLFNFVAGRWELEPFEADRTELVFIGKDIAAGQSRILYALDECRLRTDEARMTNDERMTKPKSRSD